MRPSVFAIANAVGFATAESLGPKRTRAFVVAAKRIGVSSEEYARRWAAGELWCTGCKAWHAAEAFAVSRTTVRGRLTTCKLKRNANAAARMAAAAIVAKAADMLAKGRHRWGPNWSKHRASCGEAGQ